MSFLAVAMASSGADLSDEQNAAVGPGTIYGFILVGGLYNVVLVGEGATRVAGLALYLFVIWAYWLAGVERAELCMDAEALGGRRVRVADGATLVVLYAVGARGIATAGSALGGGRAFTAPAWIGLVVLLGIAAGVVLVRRPRAVPRWGLGRSLAFALPLGAGAGYALAGAGAMPSLGNLTLPGAATGALALLAEELVFRGVLQRGLAEELAARGLRRSRAGVGAAVASVGLAAVAMGTSGIGGPGMALTGALVGSHVAAAAVWGFTGRTSAAWLARLASVSAAAAVWR
jgi:membrane protease YdiL (CAAX protease family)